MSHVIVTTPTYSGQLHQGYVAGLLGTMQTLQQRGVGFSWACESKCSLLPYARNKLAARFLASDCSHVMMVDTDISFPGDAVLRLLSHGEDMICVPYCAKNPGPPSFDAVPLDEEEPRLDHRGLLELRSGSTGFLLVARRVLEAMIEAYPESRITSVDWPVEPQIAPFLADLFPSRLEPGGHYGSEDWGFSVRARSLHFRVWADVSISLGHHGDHCYGGDVMEGVLPALEPPAVA
jgi:hypothetical protein